MLEVGTGIGTLTYTVLTTLARVHRTDSGYSLVSTEKNEYCRTQLRANLGSLLDRRFRLLESAAELEQLDTEFDFVIADDNTPDDSLLFKKLRPGAVVFFEGNRSWQLEALERTLAGHAIAQADVRVLRRRPDANPRCWDGGYRLCCLDPTPRDRLRLGLLRIRTALVYRLRPLAGPALGIRY